MICNLEHYSVNMYLSILFPLSTFKHKNKDAATCDPMRADLASIHHGHHSKIHLLYLKTITLLLIYSTYTDKYAN
jgi:hypothetical protein